MRKNCSYKMIVAQLILATVAVCAPQRSLFDILLPSGGLTLRADNTERILGQPVNFKIVDKSLHIQPQRLIPSNDQTNSRIELLPAKLNEPNLITNRIEASVIDSVSDAKLTNLAETSKLKSDLLTIEEELAKIPGTVTITETRQFVTDPKITVGISASSSLDSSTSSKSSKFDSSKKTNAIKTKLISETSKISAGKISKDSAANAISSILFNVETGAKQGKSLTNSDDDVNLQQNSDTEDLFNTKEDKISSVSDVSTSSIAESKLILVNKENGQTSEIAIDDGMLRKMVALVEALRSSSVQHSEPAPEISELAILSESLSNTKNANNEERSLNREVILTEDTSQDENNESQTLNTENKDLNGETITTAVIQQKNREDAESVDGNIAEVTNKNIEQQLESDIRSEDFETSQISAKNVHEQKTATVEEIVIAPSFASKAEESILETGRSGFTQSDINLESQQSKSEQESLTGNISQAKSLDSKNKLVNTAVSNREQLSESNSNLNTDSVIGVLEISPTVSTESQKFEEQKPEEVAVSNVNSLKVENEQNNERFQSPINNVPEDDTTQTGEQKEPNWEGRKESVSSSQYSGNTADDTVWPPLMPYSFAYEVRDDDTRNYQNRVEFVEDGILQGSFSYLGADGIIRTVTYKDEGQGFEIDTQFLPVEFSIANNEASAASATSQSSSLSSDNSQATSQTVSASDSASSELKKIVLPETDIGSSGDSKLSSSFSPISQTDEESAQTNDDFPSVIFSSDDLFHQSNSALFESKKELSVENDEKSSPASNIREEISFSASSGDSLTQQSEFNDDENQSKSETASDSFIEKFTQINSNEDSGFDIFGARDISTDTSTKTERDPSDTSIANSNLALATFGRTLGEATDLTSTSEAENLFADTLRSSFDSISVSNDKISKEQSNAGLDFFNGQTIIIAQNSEALQNLIASGNLSNVLGKTHESGTFDDRSADFENTQSSSTSDTAFVSDVEVSNSNVGENISTGLLQFSVDNAVTSGISALAPINDEISGTINSEVGPEFTEEVSIQKSDAQDSLITRDSLNIGQSGKSIASNIETNSNVGSQSSSDSTNELFTSSVDSNINGEISTIGKNIRAFSGTNSELTDKIVNSVSQGSSSIFGENIETSVTSPAIVKEQTIVITRRGPEVQSIETLSNLQKAIASNSPNSQLRGVHIDTGKSLSDVSIPLLSLLGRGSASTSIVTDEATNSDKSLVESGTFKVSTGSDIEGRIENSGGSHRSFRIFGNTGSIGKSLLSANQLSENLGSGDQIGTSGQYRVITAEELERRNPSSKEKATAGFASSQASVFRLNPGFLTIARPSTDNETAQLNNRLIIRKVVHTNSDNVRPVIGKSLL